jgi:hypothetical protein
MVKGTPLHPDEWLLRRGHNSPLKNYLNPDGTATSRVFKLRAKDNGSLSVDVKSLTHYGKAARDVSKFILFELANKMVLDTGLTSEYDPLPDGSNDAHAVILGMEEDDEILPRKLAGLSRRETAPW